MIKVQFYEVHSLPRFLIYICNNFEIIFVGQDALCFETCVMVNVWDQTFAIQKSGFIISLPPPSILFVLFVLRFNVPVNNFSVMSGRSQRFLGLTSTVGSRCALLKDTTR